MTSPAGSEGAIPHAREEAPASNRWIEQDDAKEADGGVGEMMKEVAGLRHKLQDREEMESTRVAEAKSRLASASERAAMLLDDLVEQESKEERRFETWTEITEDLQEMNARQQRGESPQALPGDGWGGMTESLDSEIARMTSLVDAAGPSPSSVVGELKARQAYLEKEEECGPSHELERQIQELFASERREGFEEGVGGSATTTTSTNTSTNANEQSAGTNTNTTTDTNTPTNTNHQSPNTNDQSATTNDQSATTNDQSANTDDQSATTNDQSANSSTNTDEESTTVTSSSPSVGVLREEKQQLCRRLKKYNELTEQLLESIDDRQADADEIIRDTEEALLACNARRKVLRVAIKGAGKKKSAVSARVKELNLAQAERHIPPANSITEEIASWEEEEFYYAFIERVRAAGGDSEEKDVFIAEEILCEEDNWYVRRQLLGEGGFGRVEKVSAFSPREYFALKTLKTDMEGGSEEDDSSLLKTHRELFMAEMAVHCRLPAHTNIVQAKAMEDRSPSKLEILYELGECDFTKHSWGHPRSSLCEVMGHLIGVTAGLMFLHEHNIGHNDLKPENIILFKGKPGTGYKVKLADLGFALAFGDSRKGHGSLGITPPEAILERFMACRPDQDVFAVGHLILLIVTKRRYKNYNMFLSRAVAPKDFDLQMTKLDNEGKCRLMEKKTLRRMVSPDYRRKLFDPSHISDKLGELKGEVLGMVDSMTAVDPSRRPSMKTVEAFVARIHQRLLENRALSAAGPPPATAVEEGGTDPEQSAPSKRSAFGGSDAVSADLPSVEVLPAEETGGGSDGGGGSAGGPSVPVVTPANREGGLCQSEVGTVAGETARLLEDVIDGAGAPAAAAVAVTAAAAPAAAAAAASPAAAAPAAASPTAPTTADPEQSEPPARSTLGGSNAMLAGLSSVEILSVEETGGGSDGGGGPTVGPSVPVAAPANRAGEFSRSEVGTVEGETSRLPEGIIDGAAAAAAAASAAAPAAVAGVSASAPPPAAAAATAAPTASAPTAADPEKSTPPARSVLGGSSDVPDGLPSVEVLSAEETRGGNDGSCGGGSMGGLSVPVVTPANREGGLCQSEVGTVAGETARLPEAIIDGGASPADAGAAVPDAAVVATASAASLAAVSAAASAPATADPEQSVPPSRSALGGSNVVPASLPSVEVLPAEETGGGSDGGGGSTGGPSVSVAAPANREGDLRRSEVGTVAEVTARLPEAIIDDAAAPAATAGAGAAPDAAVVTTAASPPTSPSAAASAPAAADPEQSAPPARSALGDSNAVPASLSSVEVLSAEETGGGSDGGGGSTGGPSVPVAAPANREGGLRRSEVGTVAGETARLPEAIIDGAAAPAAPAGAGAAPDASVVTTAASPPTSPSAAASAPAAADPEKSAPPARSALGDSNAVPAGLPSVEVLSAEETGGGSDDGGGSTGGPSVPVAAPANREGGLRRSEVGTVAGVTPRLPEAIIDGAAAPAATAGAGAAPDAAVVTTAAAPPTSPSAAASAPAAADPEQSVPPARSALGDNNAVPAGLPSVEVLSAEETGGGSDGGGGSTGGPSVPVVTPANREGDIRQSEVGTVAGKTACLPEVTIDGAATPAAAAGSAASAAAVAATAASLTSASSAVASAPATAAAGGVTRSRKAGDGSGEGGGGGGGGGGGAASLAKLPSAATSATVAQEIPGCVSVEELAANGECERQASAPGLVGSACVVPPRAPNAIAATEETGVVPTARVGPASDVCGSGSPSISRVPAGAPVQSSQATAAVARRAGVIAPSAVDGGGAAPQAPCEGVRRAAQITTEHDRERGTGAEWLLQGVCKAARQAPCRGARRSAQNTTGHKGKRGKGAEWLLQDVCKATTAALPQKVAGVVAGGGVNYVAPSRVNAREVKTTPQVAASPPPSGVHGGFHLAHIVRAAVARLVPPPRRDAGGAAAPPPSQAVLGWAGWGVFSRCGDVASVNGRAGGGVDGGCRASAGKVAGVPTARAGPWQAGAVHGPSYGGLAPHAYAPCGGYGGWTAPKHQWTFVACGAPGYHP